MYQSDSDTEGKEKDKDLEALQGQEERSGGRGGGEADRLSGGGAR